MDIILKTPFASYWCEKNEEQREILLKKIKSFITSNSARVFKNEDIKVVWDEFNLTKPYNCESKSETGHSHSFFYLVDVIKMLGHEYVSSSFTQSKNQVTPAITFIQNHSSIECILNACQGTTLKIIIKKTFTTC
jgi:hypothetical protein